MEQEKRLTSAGFSGVSPVLFERLQKDNERLRGLLTEAYDGIPYYLHELRERIRAELNPNRGMIYE